MFHTHFKGASRILLVFALLLVLVGGIFIVSAQDENTLRIGFNAPVELDPALGSADSEIALNRSIYDYLIEIAPDNSLQPNLAESWEISDDGLTYTFHLRDGVTFHNGSAFTAADVVYTFNRMVELESPGVAIMGDFSVEAADDLTVVFALASPNADFLYGVGSNFAVILQDGTESPNVLVEGDNPYVNFNGTGPFVLQEYRPGETAVLVRNEAYWLDGAPVLDSIVFVYIDDPLEQINAIRSGAVDVIYRLPDDQIGVLDETEGITVVERATNRHPVVRLRADEGFLGENPLIRMAFKLATDRDAINEILLDGRGVIGNNDPIGPLYGDYYNADLEHPAYDPQRACELILEATGQERISTTLYTVDSFNYADLAVILQQQWEEGCIDVDVLVRPENVYYGDNEWLEVELGITGWGSRPVPQDYLTQAYVTGGPFNETHWSTDELDGLVADAASTTDPAARADIYHQISVIFAEEGPIIIPFFGSISGAYRDGVEGLDMHPFPGRTDYRAVSISR